MLNVIRKYARTWIIKTTLSLIVLVFVFWGVGNFKSNRFSNVLTVNGESISLQDYYITYNDVLEQIKATVELDLSKEDIASWLKSFALERLVDHKLLVQQAVKVGLSVTDQELIDYIQSNPLFLNDGVFNIQQYHTILSGLSFTSSQFEIRSRDFLLMKKYLAMFDVGVNISDMEIFSWYDWYNSLIDLSYVVFNPNDYKEITYDREEVSDYYDSYKEKYKTDNMIKLLYVVFDPNDYLDEDIIEETEIVEYYNTNSDIFINKKTVNVSHILIKADGTLSEKKEAEEHAREISELAAGCNDFSELAILYSECPSREKGGLLGDIMYDSVVEAFAKKAFSMSSGEISSPIRTQFGWHILKVNSIREAQELSLNDAREQIVKILTRGKADSSAYERADEFLKNCFNRNDLFDTAKLYKIRSFKTDWLNIEKSTEFGEETALVSSIVSSMQIGQISDIHEIDGSYWILQLSDKIDSEIPSFEDIESKVLEDFDFYKRQIKANEDAKSFIKTVKDGKKFTNVAESYGLNLYSTGFLKRNKPVSDTNIEEGLVKELLNMVRGNITLKPVKGNQGFYVASFNERKKPKAIHNLDDPIYEQYRTALFLFSQKKSTLFSKLLESLKAESEIKIENGYGKI